MKPSAVLPFAPCTDGTCVSTAAGTGWGGGWRCRQERVLAIATGVLDGLAAQQAQLASARIMPGQECPGSAADPWAGRDDTSGGGAGGGRDHLHGVEWHGRSGADGDRRPQPESPGGAALLAQGLDADAAVRSLGHVAEGVYCARTVLARAESLGVDMPIITRCVVALLDGSISPVETAVMLMERDARSEHG